jgi:large subunit ribosomal protein L4e
MAKSSGAPVHVAHHAAEAHHKVHVLTLEGKPGESTVALPPFFSVPYRPDLIQRAVVAGQANNRQPYGSDPLAGLRHSVEWPGKGRGMARTPRVKTSNRGGQVPNTVGGREAHPPRAETNRGKRINVKERQRALASALAATKELHLALERGHKVPEHAKLPIIFEDSVEDVSSTGQAREILKATGLWSDVERAVDGTHVRSGKGKGRGRVRRTPKSILVIVSKPGAARGFRNFPGVDVVPVESLGTEHLAPGGQAGRLTIFSPVTIQKLQERFGKHLLPTSVPAYESVTPGGHA